MTFLMTIVWKPAASPLHILAVAGVLAALSAFAYARTWSGRRKANTALLAMRLAVIAALATLLMGPSRVDPLAKDQARPRLTVLLDASASMLTPDAGGASRIDCALKQWLSGPQRNKLAELYDVKLMSFAGELAPLGEPALARPGTELATGRATNLPQCVSKAILEGGGPSGQASLLVVSDGHDSNDAPVQPAALLGRARKCPVHTVALGGATLQRDLALAAMTRQEYLLAGEPGEIVARVYQVGYDNETAAVRLDSAGQVQSKTVKFDGQSSALASFTVKQAKAGLYEYKVSVDPLPGEKETGNNAQSVFGEVTEQKIRVLLLEGEPFWETKFLAQSLRKEPGVELTQITRVSSRKAEGIITNVTGGQGKLPRTAEDLAPYDVIIVGKGVEQLFDASTVSLLPDFVMRRGGALVFVRGQAYDPDTPLGRQMGRDLAVIEPVVWGRGYLHNMSLSLTSEGRTSPCFRFTSLAQDPAEAVSRLPGFAIMPVVEREKVSTIVQATVAPPGAAAGAGTARGQPGIVQMKCGRGRVMAVLGEGLWRWSLLAPDMKAYDSVYDEFWSNTIRTLAMDSDFLPGQTVCLKTERSSVPLGEPVRLEAVFKTPPPPGQAVKITVTGPDGRTESPALTPADGADRVQGRLTPARTGVYRVELEAAGMTPARQEKRFSVYDVNFEKLQTAARPDALRQLAEQAG
ncbi:MAG: hypothetical protein NTV86_16580, partial [Planctomycetota bacterium]|nr:hypothetical protein [Planctomycetota bacterium]